MGRFQQFSNLGALVRFEFQRQLSGRQFKGPWSRREVSEHGVCSEQTHGIGQQAHRPSQPETIEKESVQPQLVFLVGLAGFNPRSSSAQKPLSYARSQWNQPEENFVLNRLKTKLAGTALLLMAEMAERLVIDNSEPLQLVCGLIAQPLHSLTFWADCRGSRFKRRK